LSAASTVSADIPPVIGDVPKPRTGISPVLLENEKVAGKLMAGQSGH
jgi:hypothetical protein